MSRVLLVALLATVLLALSALPASAGSVKLTAPASSTATDQTSQAVTVDVVVTADAGTCLGGGGTITVTLQPMVKGANATASLTPDHLSFNVGQTDTATAAKDFKGTATLLVSAGVVDSPTTVNATVNASAVASCAAPSSPTATFGTPTNQASTTVNFQPLGALSQTNTEQPVPGVGLPALLAILAVAVVALRRSA